MEKLFGKREISQRDIDSVNLTFQRIARELRITLKELKDIIREDEPARRGFTSKEMAECQTAILDN